MIGRSETYAYASHEIDAWLLEIASVGIKGVVGRVVIGAAPCAGTIVLVQDVVDGNLAFDGLAAF